MFTKAHLKQRTALSHESKHYFILTYQSTNNQKSKYLQYVHIEHKQLNKCNTFHKMCTGPSIIIDNEGH